METKPTPIKTTNEARWKVLGELALPLKPGTDLHMMKWLVETLQQLDLPSDLIGRIMISASQARVRIFPSGNEGGTDRLIHTLVYAPVERAPTGQTWGFFRIEKLAPAGTDGSEERQVIEFYLYLEGARSS